MNVKRLLTTLAVTAVAAASLTGCAGTTSSLTAVTFIPSEGAGLAETLQSSSDPIADYRLPAGRPGSLELQFPGPDKNGTTLNTCTLMWTNVGTTTIKPVTKGDEYIVTYALPGGVSAGTNPATLACGLANGTDYSIPFSLTGAYQYLYWTTATSIGRVRLGEPASAEPHFISGLQDVRAVAVYGNTIFFSNSEGVGTANLDGTDVDKGAIKGAGNPRAITVYNQGSSHGESIELAGPLDYSGWYRGFQVYSNPRPEVATALASEPGVMAESREVTLRNPVLSVSSAAGSGWNQSIPSAANGIALVNGDPYWSSGGSIHRFAKNAKSKIETVMTAKGSQLFGLAYDGTHLLSVVRSSDGVSSIQAFDQSTFKLVIYYTTPQANGGIAVGGGYDSSTTVGIKDSQGHSVSEITANFDQQASSLQVPLGFSVVNRGKSALNVTCSQIDPTNAFFTVTCPPGQVGSGDSAAVSLLLSLPGPATYKTVVRLSGNIYPRGHLDVPVSVTWTPIPPPTPDLTITPDSHDFGKVAVGYPSDSMIFTIKYTASGALTIGSDAVSVEGLNDADFQTGTDTCEGTTLTQNTTCTVEVLFAPFELGARTASLRVDSTAAGSPHTAALSGTGVEPALSYDLTPTTVNTAPGSSGWSILTLTNEIDTPVTITAGGLTLSGLNPDKFTLSDDTCTGKTIAVGGHCTVKATFSAAPGDSGPYIADLAVLHDGAGNPLLIILSGIVS